MNCQLCGKPLNGPAISEVKMRRFFLLSNSDEIPKVCCNCFRYFGGKRKSPKAPNLGFIKHALESKSYSSCLEAVGLLQDFIKERDRETEKLIKQIKIVQSRKDDAFKMMDVVKGLQEIFPGIEYEIRRQEADKVIAGFHLRLRVFKRDKWTCRRCGVKERLSIDHIISVLNGGGDQLENLQTLCLSCNSSKGAL